jgi:hypothetical protein
MGLPAVTAGVRGCFFVPLADRYRVFLGPAKNQMMNPSTGRISTSTVHSTLRPVVAELEKMFTIAQMSATRTMSPHKLLTL